MQITKGIFSTFFSKLMVAILGLAIVVISSKFLGAEGRGIISLMMSLIAFLQLFCDFGSNSAIINLSYQVDQRRLWLSSLVWVLLICMLSYIPIFFFSHIRFIYLVPVAALLYSFINVNSLLLMGNRRVSMRNAVLVATPLLLLCCFAILLFNSDLYINAYPLALFLSLSVAGVLSFLMLKDKLKPSQSPFMFEKRLLQQGAWVQGGHAVQFLNYRFNFFIVAYLMGEASLGIYNNAVILAESIWILGHSIGQMQHMKILNTSEGHLHISLTNKFIKINFLGSMLLMAALVSLPEVFWSWLFSEDFKEMHQLFIFLAPGVLCFSISNIINHFLHAKNDFKSILRANIAGLFFGVITSIILIPSHGLVGACISWSTGLAASLVTYIIIYKSYLKNN
jgi:O-antigen/teichoic acid export membrane protein